MSKTATFWIALNAFCIGWNVPTFQEPNPAQVAAAFCIGLNVLAIVVVCFKDKEVYQ